MRELAGDNQELVFWSKAASAPDRAALDPKWQELAQRLARTWANRSSE